MPPKMPSWAGYKDNKTEEKQQARLIQKTRQKYLTVCKSQGLYPVSCVVKELLKSDIELASRQLGPDNIRIIAILLVENETVSSLNIKENCLGDIGICVISDMLTNNTFLTQLNVADNMIGLSGLQRLVSSLTCGTCLVSKLDISGNGIDYNGAIIVADLIQRSRSLKELRANNNNIGDRGGVSIGTALANNHFLEVLDLSWNHLRCKGAVTIANSLNTNNCLKTLDVSWNGFARDGAKAIGQSLAVNEALEELDISSNRIEANGMATVMVGLRTNKVLKKLKIGQNPYNSEVAMYLLKTLLAANKSAVENLDLTDISVSDDFLVTLEKLRQKRNVHVTHGNVVHKAPNVPKEGNSIDPSHSHDDPLNLMFEFKYEHGYRTLDLLKRMDTDRNMIIDKPEFKQGLHAIGIEVTDSQLDEIYKQLDVNRDGGVDYGELMVGEKEYGSRAKRNTKMKTRHNLTSIVSSILGLELTHTPENKTDTSSGGLLQDECACTTVDDANHIDISRDDDSKAVT